MRPKGKLKERDGKFKEDKRTSRTLEKERVVVILGLGCA